MLSACAAQPTPYKPRDGNFGYNQVQLDAATWRVEFAGNADTPRQTVETYLLYRCAEIMLFGGFEGFIILEKEVERVVEYRTFGRHGHHLFGRSHRSRRHHGFHHYDTFSLNYYTAIATIRTYGDATTPAGLKVYRARDVIARLGPTIRLGP